MVFLFFFNAVFGVTNFWRALGISLLGASFAATTPPLRACSITSLAKSHFRSKLTQLSPFLTFHILCSHKSVSHAVSPLFLA